MKSLSTPAIKHLVVLNMAIGILRVRKFKDVVAKAVGITKEKKKLNQMRKMLSLVDNELESITGLIDTIFKKLNQNDLSRIKKGHSAKIISMIPETKTNPEILGLYLLFLEFQEDVDMKLDEALKPCLEFDYMKLIITISEEIGLEKDVSDDMYLLAEKLIVEIKR